MQDRSLTDLIAAAQKGDDQAYHALVDLYASRVYGFLYRLVCRRDEAEDLMQEVFLRVVRMLSSYQDDGRFEAWLFRIAANLVRDRIRRIRRRPSRVDLDGGDDDGDGLNRSVMVDDEPSADMERREEVDRLNHAMQQLPDSEREVIALRHYSQLSFKEIADLMGTPLGTALARSHRALQRLKAIMESSEDPNRAEGHGGSIGNTGMDKRESERKRSSRSASQ